MNQKRKSVQKVCQTAGVLFNTELFQVCGVSCSSVRVMMEINGNSDDGDDGDDVGAMGTTKIASVTHQHHWYVQFKGTSHPPQQ